MLIGEWLDLPGCVIEGRLRGTEQKFKTLRLGRRVLSGIADGDLVNQRVESGAQLIEHLAKVESQCLAGEVLGSLHEENSLPIVLYAQTRKIGFALIKKGVPQFPEFRVVNFGPLQAGTRPPEFH